MIKIILSLLFFTFSLNAQVVIKTNVKTAEGIGSGFSRQEAVSNALAEALGKLNGVKISKTMLKTSRSIRSTEGNEHTYTYSNAIKRITKGRVDSFKILNVDEFDGKYEASVRIKKIKVTKSYKTPGLNHNKRRSIVVIPANFRNDSFYILGERKTSIATNVNLSQELLNGITQTRKFNVLDREESRAFYSEQYILRSENVQKDEALKLGNMLGADYLLLTSIKDINIEKEKANKYIASTNDSYEASVTVQFKVITTATRQVKFSNTRIYNLVPQGNSKREIYYDVLSQVSGNIASELIENIYPIKVLDTTKSEITLNQGNLTIGDKYEVYSLGKRIVDSYTKESLGRKESKVGTIEIIRVLPKYSVASIIEGEASKGNIVRSLYTSQNDNDSEIYNKIGKESDVEIENGGGVSLPFD